MTSHHRVFPDSSLHAFASPTCPGAEHPLVDKLTWPEARAVAPYRHEFANRS